MDVNKILKNKEKTALLGAFIITLIMVLIFITGYYLGRGKQTNNANIKVLGEYTPNADEPKNIELLEIFSRSGKVTKIDDREIFFMSQYLLDGKYLEAELRTTVTNKTMLIKRDLSEVYVAASESNLATGAQTISLKDVKIGDDITVFTDENIKYQTTFNAARVEITYQS